MYECYYTGISTGAKKDYKHQAIHRTVAGANDWSDIED